eukprot:1768777-Alexandrium_andersonii.AAC.1
MAATARPARSFGGMLRTAPPRPTQRLCALSGGRARKSTPAAGPVGLVIVRSLGGVPRAVPPRPIERLCALCGGRAR